MGQPLHRSSEYIASDRLNPKQKEAVEFILNSRDLAVNLRGAPGTGKTWTLQDLKRGLEEADRRIVAIAPTKSAEEELGRVGFLHTLTVTGLLQDKDVALRMAGAAVIIDEASMLSARAMFDLVASAQKYGSRLIFVGDTHQLASVEAGDSLRILEEQSRIRSFELSEPQRQKNTQYKEAIQAMRNDPEKGFDLLVDAGAVTEVSDMDRPEAVAKARRAAVGDTIVVCPSHAEIAAVTTAIRADRRAHEELGTDYQFTRLEPLNWTEAERRDLRAVVIATKSRIYVPSWAHYLVAEGTDTEVSIHFTTHVVRIKGSGLGKLLHKLTFQRISDLFVPSRADRFRQPEDAPGISDISVEPASGAGKSTTRA